MEITKFYVEGGMYNTHKLINTVKAKYHVLKC